MTIKQILTALDAIDDKDRPVFFMRPVDGCAYYERIASVEDEGRGGIVLVREEKRMT